MNQVPVHTSPVFKKIGLSLVVVAGFGGVIGIWTLLPGLIKRTPVAPANTVVTSFKDAAEYTAYISDSQSRFSNGAIGLSGRMAEQAMPTVGTKTDDLGTGTPRTIGTNVQVRGLDEPDTVKTNGRGIFLSRQPIYTIDTPVSIDPIAPPIPLDSTGNGASATAPSRGVAEDLKNEPVSIADPEKILPNVTPQTTSVIDARQLDALRQSGTIPDSGQLLLAGKSLIVLNGTTVIAYDISNVTDPKKTWTMPLADGTTIVTGRGSDKELWLVTQQWAQPNVPCPLTISKSSIPVDLPCGRLFHPIESAPTSVVLTVLSMNPENGAINDRVGFTGTDGVSAVYVSPTAVYLTYPVTKDQATVESDFYHGLGSVLPANLRSRLLTLDGYSISAYGKLSEFQRALAEYMASLPQPEQTALQKKLTEARAAFDLAHQRDILQTGIVKIDPAEGKVVATGSVPGMLLNQYSLDEFDGHLRLATTVGPSWWGSTESTTNDIYILRDDLKRAGALLDLGRTERIYAARFVRDRAYLVTFQQTDPFFVVDLANPTAPTLAGELKLPGYSSYLHPLTPTLILGVGQDGANAKATLFDVSDAKNPKEVTTMNLQASWSEVNGDPHAFLHDPDHAAVFIPAGEAGVVLTYTASGLKEVVRTTGLNAHRAVVLGDRMIIIGDTTIKTIRESDWTVDQTLSFN